MVASKQYSGQTSSRTIRDSTFAPRSHFLIYGYFATLLVITKRVSPLLTRPALAFFGVADSRKDPEVESWSISSWLQYGIPMVDTACYTAVENKQACIEQLDTTTCYLSKKLTQELRVAQAASLLPLYSCCYWPKSDAATINEWSFLQPLLSMVAHWGKASNPTAWHSLKVNCYHGCTNLFPSDFNNASAFFYRPSITCKADHRPSLLKQLSLGTVNNWIAFRELEVDLAHLIPGLSSLTAVRIQRNFAIRDRCLRGCI